MNKAFIDFVKVHLNNDTARLLLSAARYPDIDMVAAVQQIEGLRTASVKWPSLLACDSFLFPPRINREQASSEAAANYKAALLSRIPSASFVSHPRIADLTGGMGIDTLAFAKVAEHVDYVECNPQLCAVMEHNLQALGVGNVNIHNAESLDWLASSNKSLDVLYIDPARRSSSGRKVAAFEDCTPDILSMLPMLTAAAGCIMVKASPMIDISQAVAQLGGVNEVHVVAVRGECKEVLFILGTNPANDPRIVCVNLRATGTDTDMFSREEERAASSLPPFAAPDNPRYLYDPHAALMKGGCFALISQRYGVAPVSRGVHLYASSTLMPEFPGRVFEVVDELNPSLKEVRRRLPDGRASVVSRGYPLSADALRQRLKLKDGNDMLLIATTVGGCHKLFLARNIKSDIQ